MDIVVQQALSHYEKERILELWNREYPDVIQYPGVQDFERYLSGLESLYHLLLLDADRIAGWLFLFRRDGETWFSMILDKTVQGVGQGKRLLQHAGTLAPVLNGWVIDKAGYRKKDGSAYRSPVGFYEQQGFVRLGQRMQQPFEAVKMQWVRKPSED